MDVMVIVLYVGSPWPTHEAEKLLKILGWSVSASNFDSLFSFLSSFFFIFYFFASATGIFR